MGPWVQGLFGTHSSFTHMSIDPVPTWPQKAVWAMGSRAIWYHVLDDPVPTHKADGHFTVARTLLYGSLGPRAIWYT